LNRRTFTQKELFGEKPTKHNGRGKKKKEGKKEKQTPNIRKSQKSPCPRSADRENGERRKAEKLSPKGGGRGAKGKSRTRLRTRRPGG